MALQKYVPSNAAPSLKPLSFSNKVHEHTPLAEPETSYGVDNEVEIDLSEVYFLIMHFLSAGPCQRTYGQLWNELLEHQLLPRRYHAWYSRNGVRSGDEDDDGSSFPLSYTKLVERYPHIEKDHLVKLLKQLLLSTVSPLQRISVRNAPRAADVPTLLGSGSFSLLTDDKNKKINGVKRPPIHLRWPHMHADQVRGLGLREIGGGFTRHHRAPSIHAACYAIAKPSTMVQKMQNIKRLRGHRNAVYCAILDRSGRYAITGSDDRLVKIWSMETAYCLASCRGHEGDITDLAVSSNNTVVASSSNDCIIRVWRLPDGLPISVLRGHTGAVTAIAFSPRPSSIYQLLSSSDDGTCRLWDARYSQFSPRIYVPKPSDAVAGKNNGPSSSSGPQSHQIFCCAFNANGTVFVTGSSDNLARVWNACKSSTDDPNQPNHEIDVLSGHENDVNYVQFSGCAVASRFSMADGLKEENTTKFKNSWFSHDNIVTCSHDGSAIIWIPRSRRSHGKLGRWVRAYHLKVPPPPMPPQPPRGGPRQRILPTPRGVNMIVWSLDNRFVLAAIMDCRICVWNAADGSLVHSLTGHTESTYVLDVHPFNPRIAMSAGYDGKTIVWDIWEGMPIRIYEISRFKLVDGKFSPDGTSIILSDDVGQLYILYTGEGESQKDAKYDQFFLGDYRPLVQDTHGNVLDQQETQLAPYRRNLQDLLCDSGMVPYTEPYQTMYQQRRLGALGLEWRPSSLKLAIGPDITLDQYYEMPPLADLDVFIEPLPEFIDVMDWEPENEVRSDDTDSEYNVTEEDSAGGEQGSVSSSLSGGAECSTEDSDVEGTDMDGLRRSKRKKQKEEIGITTSSGRRVKRRNLDERDGNSFRSNQNRKSRKNQKGLKRKSSTAKSLRPRRAAARNALTWFSKITGTSTDGEYEDGSEGNSSENESTLQDSNFGSDESDKSLQNEQSRQLKGKEVSLDESEDGLKSHDPEFNMNSGNRRLVLKLLARDSKKFVMVESPAHKYEGQHDLVGSSSRALGESIEGNGNHISSPHTEYSLIDANCSGVERRRRGQLDKVEDHFDLSEGYKKGAIRWGGVKARTAKRQRVSEAVLSDACNGSAMCLDDKKDKEIDVNEHIKPEGENGILSPHLDGQNDENKASEITLLNGKNNGNDASEILNGAVCGEELSNINERKDFGESSNCDHLAAEDIEPSVHLNNGIDCPPELKDSLTPISTTLRLRSRRIPRDSGTQVDGRHDASHDSSLDIKPEPVLEVPNNYGFQESDAHHDESSRSTSHDFHSNSKKMYDVVYRRLKSSKNNNNVKGDGGMREGHSNSINHNLNAGGGFHEVKTNGTYGTRSMGQKMSMHDSNKHELEDACESSQKSSMKFQLPCEELGSSMVGLRSTRNRRIPSYFRDTSPVDRRKSHQSTSKGSWLMLSMHEEGSRYIPQQGDEVAYLRQGHQEYLDSGGLKELGPWKSMKGNLRAVEFCNIEGLEYSTLPGSGDSCCKMRLKFVDPDSSVFHKVFKLTLPEVTSFPDFLVERSRFESAMQRNWTCRDRCRVWWKNESEEDGSWWDGRILSVKPKSSEFPDSPWEKYTIQYKSDPTETHLHSPWELFDADTQWEQPHIDDKSRDMLLASFAKLEQSGNKVQDQYGVQKLKQVSQKSNFTNRFPVPLSLEVIQSRLDNNYYRSLEAVKHDIAVMLSNAETYFAKNAELSVKIRRQSDFISRTLSSM
ncbi:WD40 domain-containing protein/Bromodomain domain-containing protein [Cephalotus follicularis]|uniref:WD40 domain-containing protein/Bromodomain domain-containing protein n=1 Tax=Cephalotus follicularis TaxID=3775 RepID=A0A1Q3BSD0_CEPFO|nr:WD40 domain-containing protein/Bromodomain domain-containing protein [Cephalotus follicularis]